MPKAKYPEHEKLAKIKDESQAIGRFLDLLSLSGRAICSPHQHNSHCYATSGHVMCDYRKGEMAPERISIEDRLAKYFKINKQKLEKEKEEMLAEIRKGAAS